MADRTLDLHGKTWDEALATFVEFYNAMVRAPSGSTTVRIDVVHGYGSTGPGGVLRQRLRLFLEANTLFLDFRLGEHVDGNQGHTLVTCRRPLPDAGDALGAEVLAYCGSPKTMTKINGKFRRHGVPAVTDAVRKLERERRLASTGSGDRKLYHAVGAGEPQSSS
ncbi:MAG: Smr/MutS family protein [Chloroflexi bacterium]|nr:Smr/MutS family protein [Chloroflexota bacterium]